MQASYIVRGARISSRSRINILPEYPREWKHLDNRIKDCIPIGVDALLGSDRNDINRLRELNIEYNKSAKRTRMTVYSKSFLGVCSALLSSSGIIGVTSYGIASTVPFGLESAVGYGITAAAGYLGIVTGSVIHEFVKNSNSTKITPEIASKYFKDTNAIFDKYEAIIDDINDIVEKVK